MCFEPVVPRPTDPQFCLDPHLFPSDAEQVRLTASAFSSAEDELSFIHSARKGAARLDCGHLLHPTCLVAWLVNQAFCPTCHMPLQLAPPGPPPPPPPPPAAHAGPLSPADAGFVYHRTDA